MEDDPPRYLAAGMTSVPEEDDWLSPPEAERLATLPYTKRRSEARLGRWTAKNAVARALGPPGAVRPLDEIVIRNAPDGAPEVLLDGAAAPVSISMTDRADWAVCVVAGASRRAGVGCDLELVEPRSRQFVGDWFTAPERELVFDSDEPELVANLVWSAKESALKVLRTGLRRDTRSVEVRLHDRSFGGWGALEVHAVEGAVFPGWWRRAGAFVLTFAADHPTQPPYPLVDPDPLEAAVPTHTWLGRPRS